MGGTKNIPSMQGTENMFKAKQRSKIEVHNVPIQMHNHI